MNYGKTQLIAAAIALAASSTAFGATIATCGGGPGVQVEVRADGQEAGEVFERCADRGQDPNTFNSGFEDVVRFGDDGSTLILGDFSGDIDPFIIYSFGVTNSTAVTLNYTFSFFSPYAGGPYNTAISSHSSSATDSTDDGIVVGAIDASGFVHNPILDGVDVPLTGIGNGCILAVDGGCDAGGPISTGIASAATGTFGIRLRFSVSPGDAYSLNGRFEIRNTAVPAPGVLALLGLGLLGMGALRRRAA